MSNSTLDKQDDLFDGLLSDFLDESDQLLAQLSNNLLQLDEWVQSLDEGHNQRCDGELLNEMFRAAHSIKGLSAMLGLDEINTLTHKIENVFDAARNDQLTVNAEVVDLVFMGLDRLTALVELLKTPDTEPVDCDDVLDRIRQLLRAAGAERQKTSQADAQRALAANMAQPDAAAPQPPKNPLADVRDEDDISDKYLSIFIDDTELSLDDLSGALMDLEDGPKGDHLRSLLAISHKIKGSAASVGLNRAAKLAHLMEDLLEDLVHSAGTLSAAAADLLLKCTGALQQYVANLRKGPADSAHFEQLARELLAAKDAETADAANGTVWGQITYVGRVKFYPNLPMAGLKAQLIHAKLDTFGEVLDCVPTLQQLDEIDELECFHFRVVSDRPREAIVAQIRLGGVQEVSVEPLAVSADSYPFSNSPQTPGPGAACGEAAQKACSPLPANVAPSNASFARPQNAPSDDSATKPEIVPAAVNADTARVQDDSDSQRPPKEPKQRGSETGQRPTETVRVDIDRLDRLMDLAGQLVINKAQFAQIGEKLSAVLNCKPSLQALDNAAGELDKMGSGELRLDSRHATNELQRLRRQVRRVQGYLEPLHEEVRTLSRARDFARDLSEAIHQLERVSDGIQQGVMDTRMVPVGPLFTRFQRVVRDLTRANGKQVRLVIHGEKTELDKRMIDELGDPLVHMVRNSVDHGIELPAQREAAGKPRQGTVTLDACHRGNAILIRVSDDGKGLDTERILSKCLEKGILTPADAEKMTPQQIHQMIWEPGLSTAAKVTDVSGRGMGMDIVKSKIEDLNGTVDVESLPGNGTAITIKLPLTLAILPSLMVEIGGDAFAMPMEAVVEIVSVESKHLCTVHGRPTALVRGRAVSVVRLSDALNFCNASHVATDVQETVLVILGETGREIGLVVDRVVGEEDIVIKSLAENYKNVHGIAGASILGDGRVSLILDTTALIDAVCRDQTTADS